VGVPAGAVFDTMELHNDPSFEKRGILQVMDHPNGPFKMPAWPVRIDGAPPRVTASPLLGQHNAEVLNAWLGVGPDEVGGRRREGGMWRPANRGAGRGPRSRRRDRPHRRRSPR